MPRSRRALIVSVVVVLVLAGAFAAIYKTLRPPQKEKRNQEIAQDLASFEDNEKTTCKDVVDKIGNTSVNEAKEYETKVALLERQWQCFANQNDFDTAISSARQLKELYSSKKDTANADLIDQRIKGLEETKAYNEKIKPTKEARKKQIDEQITQVKSIRGKFSSQNDTAKVQLIDQKVKELEDQKTQIDKEPGN